MFRWDKEGVPHKGWKCLNVIDLAEYADSWDSIAYVQCDMCRNERIRYVHIMCHPDYQGEMRVGCVCAEKMSEDYDNPRIRESALKNKIKRMENFNKKKWKFNKAKGTYSKKYKGEYITIMEGKYGDWGVFFVNRSFWNYEGKKIKSFDEAKRVAFNIFDKYHTIQ